MEGKPELPGSPDPVRADVSKFLEPIAADADPAPSSPGRPTSPGVSNISMPETKSGLIGASSNLVNSIVGAGIIGIPYAMRQSGIVVGIFLLVLVAYLTDKSLRIIIELACFHPKLKKLGVLTYEDLMSIPFGSYGSYFVLINMFILAYGAMVAYLLIIKDTVPVVLDMVDTGDGNFWERELIMIVTSLVIVVPLSMARDMASLAATSLLSVVADAILVGFVIGFSPVRSTVSEYGGFVKVLEDNWINSKLFIGLGVLSTAMACQHSAFIVSGSLENKTALRWSMVTSRSISISAAMCIMMGVTGYLGFLGATEGDVLNNFDSDSFEANAGRTLLAVTMFFTYPMECFVARHVLVKLIYNGNMDNETVGPSGETIPEVKLFGFLGRREKVTLGIYVATLIPALIVDDLGPVLSLTGSLGASCIAYIGPGLVYFGVNGEDFLIFTAKMLEDQGYKTNRKSIENGQVEELPVAGVSGAKIEMKPEPSYPQGSKPWWWYLGGFSIWCSIASYGALGTKTFLSEMEVDRGMSLQSASEDEQEEVIGPCRRDYYISMFFIIFGVIAMVVGVACNVYVELNDIFYTPT